MLDPSFGFLLRVITILGITFYITLGENKYP
jgi:hypothetical protein